MVSPKKLIIIISLAVIIIIAGLLLYFFYFKGEALVNVNDQLINQNIKKPILEGPLLPIEETEIIAAHILSQDDCALKTDEEKKKECLDEVKKREIVGESQNLKECLDLIYPDKRDTCLFSLARKYKNIDFCVRIYDHYNREICMGDVGIEQRDPENCRLFEYDRLEVKECRDRIKAFQALDGLVDITECADMTLEYSNLCMQHYLTYSKKSCADLPTTGE